MRQEGKLTPPFHAPPHTFNEPPRLSVPGNKVLVTQVSTTSL